MSWLSFSVLVLSLYILALADDNDLFSSIHEMRKLLDKEIEFSRNIFEYKKSLEKELQAVTDFIENAYPDGPIEVEDPQTYVQNPINSLGIMKRLGYDFTTEGVRDLLSKNDSKSLENLRTSLKDNMALFPSLKNFQDSAHGVGLLQESYNLNLTDLAQGVIRVDDGRTFLADRELTFEELWELGTSTCNDGWWDTGLEWYNFALKKCPSGKKSRMCDELKKFIKDGRQIHDHLLDKRGPISHQHRCNSLPFSEKLRKKKKYKDAKERSKSGQGVKVSFESKFKKIYAMYNLSVPDAMHLADNFHLMCMDYHGIQDIWRNPGMNAGLRCRLVHHNNPYLKLGPFKMEEHSEEPFVVVFHDFISDKEIESFKNYSEGKLERSLTGSRDSLVTTLERTSKQAWLVDTFFRIAIDANDSTMAYDPNSISPPPLPYDHVKYAIILHEEAYRISLRIQNATKLKVIGAFSSEPYQIANYGMGGQYSTHLDAYGFYDKGISIEKGTKQLKSNLATGDRFVTVMGYLEDVEYGGKTVFPLSGISVEAKKGDVVMWFNLLSSGHKDRLTYHGGCPVLVGSKWITNKWISYNDQFLNYPCKLVEKERYNVLETWRKHSVY